MHLDFTKVLKMGQLRYKPGLNVVVEWTSRLSNISRLSRKTAEQTAKVLIRRLHNHPIKLVKRITYDNGAESVLHEKVNNV